MKSKVSLYFLGGCGEIEGNKILLHDLKCKVKIFLDFGYSFGNLDKRYKKFQFSENFNDIFTSDAFPKKQDIGVKNLYFSKKYIHLNITFK